MNDYTSRSCCVISSYLERAVYQRLVEIYNYTLLAGVLRPDVREQGLGTAAGRRRRLRRRRRRGSCSSGRTLALFLVGDVAAGVAFARAASAATARVFRALELCAFLAQAANDGTQKAVGPLLRI